VLMKPGPDAVGCEWRIYNLRSDILDLTFEFDFCEFCWVKKEANMAAHSLAKLAPLVNLPIVYFPNNLPSPLEVIWFRDFQCIYFLV
jgi:hypothetical protein